MGTEDSIRNGNSVDVEAWLDNNPRFFEEYFMKKANRRMIDSWLTAHAKHISSTSDDDGTLSAVNDINISLRKISTHDFVTSTGQLHPMVSGFHCLCCRSVIHLVHH